jgi:hypothetical protein
MVKGALKMGGGISYSIFFNNSVADISILEKAKSFLPKSFSEAPI